MAFILLIAIGVLLLILPDIIAYTIGMIFGVWLWLDDHYFTITLGDIKGKWLNISLFSGIERLSNDMENLAERLRRFNEKYGGEIDRKYEQETYESDTHL